MQAHFEAVIFDMDGVLVDSEPLWREAMIIGFNEVGMPFNEADCRSTMGLRIDEVVKHWLKFHNLPHVDAAALEERIVSLLLELIASKARMIDGIAGIVQFCKEKNLKMGVATSSSNRLMQAVVKKLGLEHAMQAYVSAEHMAHGKPHPEVFLACAQQLQVEPLRCVVIEDSVNGVIAAKAARMTVVAVPEEGFANIDKFVLADHKVKHMTQVLALFKTLLT